MAENRLAAIAAAAQAADGNTWGNRLRDIANGAIDWLAGGARSGAEPLMALYRGDALDEPLLPSGSSGGRLGTVASALAAAALPAGVNWLRNGQQGADMLASRSSRLYNPLSKPARPFDADYPSGARTNDGGQLTHDIEGRPLHVGGRIVGRRVAGGADEALPATEFDALAEAATGRPAEVIPQSVLGRDLGRARFNRYTGQPLGIELSDRLAASQLGKVYGHEIGHVVDQLAGEIPVKGLDTELRRVFNTLNTGQERTRNLTGPQHLGYKGNDVPRELMAEAIRAYLVDPNYLKTAAPKTAAAICAAVNAHPRASRVVQFNAGVPVGAPRPDHEQPLTLQDLRSYYLDGGA